MERESTVNKKCQNQKFKGWLSRNYKERWKATRLVQRKIYFSTNWQAITTLIEKKPFIADKKVTRNDLFKHSIQFKIQASKDGFSSSFHPYTIIHRRNRCFLNTTAHPNSNSRQAPCINNYPMLEDFSTSIYHKKREKAAGFNFK